MQSEGADCIATAGAHASSLVASRMLSTTDLTDLEGGRGAGVAVVAGGAVAALLEPPVPVILAIPMAKSRAASYWGQRCALFSVPSAPKHTSQRGKEREQGRPIYIRKPTVRCYMTTVYHPHLLTWSSVTGN